MGTCLQGQAPTRFSRLDVTRRRLSRTFALALALVH
jgi:hypothetical protein